MDHSLDVSKAQDSDTAAKLRIESFKMGGSAPAHALSKLIHHSHGRSHSRNNSISSLSASAPPIPHLDFSSNTHVPPNAPPFKRNSHHRRRSSVSTRRESAELMGVSLPDLPAVHSDDNANLGDRDSIRRRALLALEGKPDLAFSKVEIPDITSPDSTKSFEFPTKPSFPPGSGINNHPISGLMSKRDSFGKMFGTTSASKDQLHTLVEEEEEEEESTGKGSEEPKETSQPVKHVNAKTFPPRHRPASLNLRPLSLVNGSVVVNSTGGLPTPSSTPSPRVGGLRSLALTTGSGICSSPNMNVMTTEPDSIVPHSFTSDKMRSISDIQSSELVMKRRSSISYKRSVDSIPRGVVSLPTPEMTPISDRHFSASSDQCTPVEQPLTAAEQHFLFRSHNVLLTRITDLERTLRSRSSLYSRPVSYSSEVSVGSSEPTDEMLQLISDLKAERDELKRDVEGWRMRVADGDKQASMLAKRIEVERRDAWVARSRLGLLEVEKTRLEKAVEDKTTALDQALTHQADLRHQQDALKEEVNKLNARLQDADGAIDECIRLRAALEQERACRQELERLLDDAGLLNTPTILNPVNGTIRKPNFPSRPFGSPRGLGFHSVDSESSTTEVESLDDSFAKAELTLDVVTEEELSEEDDDGLASYEDEDDSDLSFQSPGGSSVGSDDELDLKANVGVTIDDASKRLSAFSMPAKPTHGSQASLSKSWTFPRGHAITPIKQVDEVDRFFGCLDDIDLSPPLGSEERTKGMFASAFRRSADDEDELPPFVLPSDVGNIVVEAPAVSSLHVVLEEDEETTDDSDDELVGEEVDGGIRFTFNPPPNISITPPEICVTPPNAVITSPAEVEPSPTRPMSRKRIPLYEPHDDEAPFVPFQFPQVQSQPKPQAQTTPKTASSPASDGSRPSSRAAASPSSIPRATVLRSFSPPAQVTPSKFSGCSKGTPNLPWCSFVTPPSKKGGSASTFIPQPKPSPVAVAHPTPTKPRVPSVRTTKGPSSNQNGSAKPQPKSSMSTPNSFLLSYFTANDSVSTFRCPSSSESGGATPEVNANESSLSRGGDCPPHVPSTSLTSIMSSPLSARLSLQKISSFIPFSWTPGATTVASHIAPALSSSSSLDSAKSASLLSSDGDYVRRAAERRLVPRDKQLERLRSRLSLERSTGASSCSMVSACKGCRAGEVYL
ncbi:hypothetical protein J3A83DRAFT_4088091 [Scleroderma citrinum]